MQVQAAVSVSGKQLMKMPIKLFSRRVLTARSTHTHRHTGRIVQGVFSIYEKPTDVQMQEKSLVSGWFPFDCHGLPERRGVLVDLQGQEW